MQMFVWGSRAVAVTLTVFLQRNLGRIFDTFARRSSKLLNRLMGAILIVALASPIAFAQNGQQGTQRGRTGTASSKPFDPHDLSGFWDITNIGLPPGALNATSNNRPQMTPWGLENFRKTKTGD